MNKPIYKVQVPLAIIGILLIGLSVMQISELWLSKSDLYPLKGTLSSANFYVFNVKSSRGSDTKAIELIFYLKEYNKKLRVVEPIDEYQYGYNNRIITLHKALLNSNNITVWVNNSDTQEYSPKIYSINNDDKELLSLTEMQASKRYPTIIMLIAGLLLILAPIFYNKYLNGT